MPYKLLTILIVFVLSTLACQAGQPGSRAENPPAAASDSTALPAGDPARGESLFNGQAKEPVQCAACHSLTAGETRVGPSLAGIAATAAARADGLSAEDYIYRSILNPNEYVVDGFHSDIMPAIYTRQLTDQEIADLIAFLMTR